MDVLESQCPKLAPCVGHCKRQTDRCLAKHARFQHDNDSLHQDSGQDTLQVQPGTVRSVVKPRITFKVELSIGDGDTVTRDGQLLNEQHLDCQGPDVEDHSDLGLWIRPHTVRLCQRAPLHFAPGFSNVPRMSARIRYKAKTTSGDVKHPALSNPGPCATPDLHPKRLVLN